jgi:4-carboxymuconolactone decarboxylase
MVIIELTYKKTLDVVNEFLSSHKVFVGDYLKQGIFLTSGPKVPRDGGIILASVSIENAKELMKDDPFFINDIADFKFTEFTESKVLFQS